MELSVLIAAFLANLLSKVTKPKDSKWALTEEELASRKIILRMMNGVFGSLTLCASTYLLNEPLDIATLQGSLETVTAIAVTFLGSQGAYLLAKKG